MKALKNNTSINYLKIAVFMLFSITLNPNLYGGYTNISHFTWEIDAVTPLAGPIGNTKSTSVYISPDGSNGTYGLNAGTSGDNIELNLPKMTFDDGIYVSIDFQRDEDDADFISKNADFRLGMEAGELFVIFQVEDVLLGATLIQINSGYIIPDDDVLRQYEFEYNPDMGLAKLSVNGSVVASHQLAPFTPLCWGQGKDMVLGKRANGGLKDRAIFDNLMINMAPMSNILPVELTYFEGFFNKTKVELNWTTGSEINNSHFEIEKSIDGKNFERVGAIEGNGTTSFAHEYEFIDESTSAKENVYYRLRQVDFDGRYEYSDVIAISTKRNDIAFNIYPMPVMNNKIYLQGVDPMLLYQIIIIDINGREILNQKSVNSLEIELPQIKDGNYLVMLKKDNETLTKQITVR